MNTNHQMNYYDYAKTLSAEGIMIEPTPPTPPEPYEPVNPSLKQVSLDGSEVGSQIYIELDEALDPYWTDISIYNRNTLLADNFTKQVDNIYVGLLKENLAVGQMIKIDVVFRHQEEEYSVSVWVNPQLPEPED